jgi:hypothetical protein
VGGWIQRTARTPGLESIDIADNLPGCNSIEETWSALMM